MLTGFSIGLVAAILWSITNIIDKYLADQYAENGDVWALVILSSLFPIILLPIGFFLGAPLDVDPNSVLIMVMTGVLLVVWIYYYMKSLVEGEASTVMTLLVLTPVFSLALEYLFFDISITLLQVAAGVLVLFGAFIITIDLKEKLIKYKLLLYAMLASLTMASMLNLFKFTTYSYAYWDAIFWRSFGMFIAAGLLLSLVYKIRQSFFRFITFHYQRGLSLNACNESISLTADTVFALAILFAPIALVQTTEAFQPIFIFLILLILSKFGFKFITEDYSKALLQQKLLGMLLVLLGSSALLLVST